ncbi:hypothetical protein L2E82_33847 [Cichorium intybus]|uniref:Uncharacterized protein n=1 Tax=Cichorium intybus TaxID=13427 RepID=A0ACB9BLH1_CICIN|nr:hypothetical protein L2E82_33847 [Cichorium intybus]
MVKFGLILDFVLRFSVCLHLRESLLFSKISLLDVPLPCLDALIACLCEKLNAIVSTLDLGATSVGLKVYMGSFPEPCRLIEPNVPNTVVIQEKNRISDQILRSRFAKTFVEAIKKNNISQEFIPNKFGHIKSIASDSNVIVTFKATGLKVLPDNHIIHRDLKPQNLILSSNEDISTLEITDFGFARSLQPRAIAEILCGSPLYMTPERMQPGNTIAHFLLRIYISMGILVNRKEIVEF